jgi:hypothetical protein
MRMFVGGADERTMCAAVADVQFADGGAREPRFAISRETVRSATSKPDFFTSSPWLAGDTQARTKGECHLIRGRAELAVPSDSCARTAKKGRPMTRIPISAMQAVACLIAFPALAQDPPRTPDASPAAKEAVPAWIQRGAKGAGQAAMGPLVGSWRVELSIYGTMGRSPDLLPIVSRDIRTTRVWIADGHYIEDTTEGTVEGKPYWRRGWLGYSNIDRRYEWVTVAPLVPMMVYLGKPDSGERMPIDVRGVFTDQGVVGEVTVGKAVGQRTVFRIESQDRHVSELYFTPGGKEQLALRMVYTRVQ